MKQKTAMQLLIDKLEVQSNDTTGFYSDSELQVIENVIFRSKELLTTERRQIEEAYDAGVRTNIGIQTGDFKHGGKYYQQKYES